MRSSAAAAAILFSVTSPNAAVITGGARELGAQFDQATSHVAYSSENYSSVEAVSGNAVQLNTHASVKPDCSSAPLPTIRIIERPKNGTVTVRQGTMTDAQVGACQKLNIPVQAVFYTPRIGYVGPDNLVYEVTSFNGEVEKYDIQIAVKLVLEQKTSQ